jgi:glutamyl-Q tRNA(Asp) synthetase
LGSLYTAAASFLDARAHGGSWLVRMEDLDRPREVQGSADGILRALEKFGFQWDGPVLRQSARTPEYAAALHSLQTRQLTFECICSRLQLEDEVRYPGTCRNRPPSTASSATRLKIAAGYVEFNDRIQGRYRQDVAAAVGDIIVKRRDQIFAYVLAVVVDDAAQGVTHVVRGADLLDNTPRQIVLQRLLEVAQPRYAHVPVLTEADNSKLAKSKRSMHLSGAAPLAQLISVFSLLGLKPPLSLNQASLPEAWDWAIGAWGVDCVPKTLNLRVSD